MARMDFGITLKGDFDYARTIKVAQRVERNGFDYVWGFDSHVLWQDVYPILTLIAANTQRVKLGTLVTNPVVRDLTVTSSLFATLQHISHGRMQLGIGRGAAIAAKMKGTDTGPVTFNLDSALKDMRAMIAEGKSRGIELPLVEKTLACYEEARKKVTGNEEISLLSNYWATR